MCLVVFQVTQCSADVSGCVSGYTGQNCGTEINECQSQPCLFNGTCEDLVDGFRCQCQKGYMGQQCQAVVRTCLMDNPCGPNGICVEKPAGKLESGDMWTYLNKSQQR